jgi:U6 snRNA-associated Sm-like protein LSm6
MADQTAGESKDPASFLSSIIGVPVTVKLNSGVVYKGELQSVDGYMNIALEKCQEFVNGKLRRTYGDAFVRGNNGMIFHKRSSQTKFQQCYTSLASNEVVAQRF